MKFLKLLWQGWLKIGKTITHTLVLVMLALTYLSIVTATGLLMRILGKRPLRLKFKDSSQASYYLPSMPIEKESYERPY